MSQNGMAGIAAPRFFAHAGSTSCCAPADRAPERHHASGSIIVVSKVIEGISLTVSVQKAQNLNGKRETAIGFPETLLRTFECHCVDVSGVQRNRTSLRGKDVLTCARTGRDRKSLRGKNLKRAS